MPILRIAVILIVIYIHSGWAQQLRVASLNLSAPYMMGEGDSKEGFIIDLLDEMEINYEIVSPEDRKYGRYENGKWTGMMGMLINGKADAIGADLTITELRMEHVDFTVPYYAARLTVLSKESSSSFDVTSLIFAPFTAHLWILFVLAFFVTSLTFWVITRINPSEENECLWDSLWCISSLFVYVSTSAPKACSKRIVVIGWWIFALMLFVAYAVTLGPFLSSGMTSFRYKSVEDMLANPEFKFYSYGGGSTFKFLQNSQDDIHKEIFSRLTGLQTSNMEMTKILEENEGGSAGIIMESGTADYLIPNHCDFYTTGTLATKYYGFALPKGDSMVKTLSQKVLKLSESGTLQALKSKWWPGGDICPDNSVVGSSAKDAFSVDIPQVSGAFVLLLVFLIVGLLVSFWELLSSIKKDPSQGPLGQALKQAFCGCLKKKEIVDDPETEKKDGEQA